MSIVSAPSDSNTQIPMNLPSLCIPRVFANIAQARIRSTIEALGLGEIDRIDLVPVRDNNNTNQFQRVFIHFKKWNTNSENACKARARILENKEIKIIYDDPWFWKVSAYRPPLPRQAPRSVSGPVPRPVSGPVIDFEFSSTDTRPRQDARPRQDPRPRQDARPRQDPRPRQNQQPSHYQPQPESFYRPRSPIELPPKRKSGSDTDSEADTSSFDSAVDAAVAAIAATATATATAATATATAATATATATATAATATAATAIVIEQVAAEQVVDKIKDEVVVDAVTSIYPESVPAPRRRRVVIKKA